MRRAAYTLFVIALLLTACDSTLYDHYEHASTGGWDRNDVMRFRVPRAQAGAECALTLGLRTDNSYPFMRLTLIVETKHSPSGRVERDTLNPQLIDRNGHATGSGINNHQYELHVRNLSLRAGDRLTVSVRHDMRREVMPGITDVGIILKEL